MMKVFIKCKDSVRQPFYIRDDRLALFKEKYGDRLEVAEDQNSSAQAKYRL